MCPEGETVNDTASGDSDKVADVWGGVKVNVDVSKTGYSGESEAETLSAMGSDGIDSSGGDWLKMTGCEADVSMLSDVACCELD